MARGYGVSAGTATRAAVPGDEEAVLEANAAFYRMFDQRDFGTETWEIMKKDLAGDDLEATPYRSDVEEMLVTARFELVEVAPHGLDGTMIRARRR